MCVHKLITVFQSLLFKTCCRFRTACIVDDMSFDAPLKEPIQRYIDLLPNVKLIRHKKRSGLIVARMIGARLANSPVIIFLDAHTEVRYSVQPHFNSTSSVVAESTNKRWVASSHTT